MECNIVVWKHYIALHLIYLPFEKCKQKYCMEKVYTAIFVQIKTENNDKNPLE